MEQVTIESLLKKIKEYNFFELEKVKKAYEFAKLKHINQTRQSGEPYIIHPLNVAYILAEMHADMDTICAGLLHDTLEDTNTTKEEIKNIFNETTANLVDGVTKISKMNFSTESAINFANTRKIITGITEDVRIIIIKLADRLHNMRTLQYKSKFKQKENSLETIEIFAPLAYYIGAYRIKSELEDISLQYLKPDTYKKILERKTKIEFDNKNSLNEMLFNIKNLLANKNIFNEIKVRTKNIYGIYKNLNENKKFSDIHDLFSLKVMVDIIENCYISLGLIHQKYHPFNEKFKDYICNPKNNMYKSLHTTVFGPNERLVQVQIRTFDMDKVASFGLATYWDLTSVDVRKKMQQDLKEKFQFFKSLIEINKVFGDNKKFVDQVKKELFSDLIYVYTTKGDIIELPKNSTPIDLAYKIHTELGNTIIGAVVNDKFVPVDYILHNNDRVKILNDNLSFGPKKEWLDNVQTTLAKRKIKEYTKNK